MRSDIMKIPQYYEITNFLGGRDCELSASYDFQAGQYS